MVILGDGSVTFSIALPLEASGLVPSEVEIIVGPDPSFVLSDQGEFGGFWPEGFTVEVRDPTTGAWTVLGDLSRQSQFEIDDPSTRAELDRPDRGPRHRGPEQPGLRPGRRLRQRRGRPGCSTDDRVPVVETRGLVKRYDDQLAVAGIDLVVGPGEIFGLVGPNGAGKTTTMKILATPAGPDGGRGVRDRHPGRRRPDRGPAPHRLHARLLRRLRRPARLGVPRLLRALLRRSPPPGDRR